MTSSLTTVDWPAFLAAHDMIWETVPDSWKEAPHFGNALLGSMLYRRDGKLCLEMFRADVHDRRDETHGWTAYSRPRFRIGYFTLENAGKLTGCRWRKDLWNAELTGTITTERGEIGLRHFVHAEDLVGVTEWTGATGLRWQWHPFAARTTREGYPTDAASLDAFAKRYGEHYRPTLQPLIPNPPGRLENGMWIQDLLAGGRYVTAWKEEANRLVVGTSANLQYDPERHRAWWHAYYRRSYVRIPDKKLEALYWQTVYRLGCTARAGRSFVDTSGIWFQGGSWPYATHDWNTQAAHWGVYAANRLEQGAEIVNRLQAHRESLVRAVEPAEWQTDSAYLALATAGDLAGTRRSDMRYYHLVGCLPWLLHNAWWQYRYSMDEALLRETVFPLLRRAVNLYLHLLEEGDDGRYHLAPTYSPETGVWRDGNFDLALLKWGCHMLLQACRRLRMDDPLIPRWREVIAKLVDFPADEKGYRLGRDEPAREHHRHLSHLLMMYPLYLVNIEQPRNREILRKSCAAGWQPDKPLQAMVQAHAGPIQASVGNGDAVLAGLRRLQEELHPNGLWGEPPCIESTLAVLNNVQMMLLQSWSDPARDEPVLIRIFPALPAAWEDVEFQDLRAEGAFLVSARRRGGATEWVRVKSLAGEPCRVKLDLRSPQVEAHPRSAVAEVQPGMFELNLPRDGEVVFRQPGASVPG